MAKTARNLAIGGFVLGALVLVFTLLLFISGGSLFGNSERFVMYFDGSVQGLQPGAPVKLKGVQLGQVVDIEVRLLPEDFTVVNQVTADVDLDRINRDMASNSEALLDTVIEAGMRAQLNYQSLLTGLLYIELDFSPGTPVRLLNLQDQYREFPTRQTEIQQIIDEVTQIDLPSLTADLHSVLQALETLLDSGRIETALDDFSTAVSAMEETAKSLEETSRNLDSEIGNLSAGVDDSLDRLNQVLNRTSETIPELSDQATMTLTELRESIDTLEDVIESAGTAFSEDSRLINRATQAAEDVSRAARALEELSNMLEREPESLLRGR